MKVKKKIWQNVHLEKNIQSECNAQQKIETRDRRKKIESYTPSSRLAVASSIHFEKNAGRVDKRSQKQKESSIYGHSLARPLTGWFSSASENWTLYCRLIENVLCSRRAFVLPSSFTSSLSPALSSTLFHRFLPLNTWLILAVVIFIKCTILLSFI